MKAEKNGCQICASKNTVAINSYKQIWIICDICGCASRTRKKNYPLNNFFIKKILGRLKKWDTLYNVSVNKDVIDNEVNFYTYYKETAKKGIKGTKWEEVLGNFLNYFQTPVFIAFHVQTINKEQC